MNRKYIGIVKKKNLFIEIDGNEIGAFIVHFGRIGDIEVYDTYENEIILNTKGTIINKFFPDVRNREYAYSRSKLLFNYFKNYKQEKKYKYPRGRLKEIYKKVVKENG